MIHDGAAAPREDDPKRSIPGRHLSAFAVLIIIFVVLSLVTTGTNTLDADVRVARWVQAAPIPAASQIARFGSWIGSFTILGPLTLMVLILLVWRRLRWDALFLAITGVLHSTNSMLKWLIDSPRPTATFVEITARANGNGFPSGHATGSMLIFGALAIVGSRHFHDAWVRRGVVTICAALILIVGFARIKQGVHWPSDVLGGYLWGLAMLLLADAIMRLIKASRVQ
jgi:undecaprenyl-diphosphatase